jgi:hypothetical protein
MDNCELPGQLKTAPKPRTWISIGLSRTPRKTVVIGSIAEVNGISGSVSCAVTEQGAATSDIAQNIDQAARGAAEVAESIGDVHVAAEHSSASATQVLNAARDLSRIPKPCGKKSTAS